MSLGRLYDYLMVELADPVTRGWPLIDTPFTITIITAAYLYFILHAGLRYMKNRPPFRLKKFILFYNLFQILVNAWFVRSYISAGWFTDYTLKCDNNNDPTSPNGFKLITISWWIFLVKLVDYIETCIFVLRKKQNQVSTLHIYHHVSTVFFTWYWLKYVVDPRATMIILTNCFVHVIMYIYYFCAAWSTEMQQIMSPIKPHITKIQLAQFIGIIVYTLQFFLDPRCEISLRTVRLAWVFILNVLLFIYLFYDFYKKAYGKHYKQKTAKHEK